MFKSPIKHVDNIFAFNFLHMELSNCLHFDLAGMAQPPASSSNCRLDLFLNHIAAMEKLDGKCQSSEDGPQMQWRFSASAGLIKVITAIEQRSMPADHNHNQSTVAALIQAQADLPRFGNSLGWSWTKDNFSITKVLSYLLLKAAQNTSNCSNVFSHRQKMPEVHASLKYIPGVFASDVCNPELLATLTDTNEGVSTRTRLQRWCGLRGCKQDCQPNARFSWVFWCCPCCATFPSPYATIALDYPGLPSLDDLVQLPTVGDHCAPPLTLPGEALDVHLQRNVLAASFLLIAGGDLNNMTIMTSLTTNHFGIERHDGVCF